jgi:hypothetical protein
VKRGSTARLTAAVFLVLVAGVVPSARYDDTLVPQAQAQNFGDRTVSGTVLSPDSAPVPGATVFLKNQKTKTIRSFSSIANGHFHFAQVNMAEDFDLWAEKDGHKSAIKTVSSWDARKDFISDLKLK